MTTLAQSVSTRNVPWGWIALGGAILLMWAAIAIPNLNRSREAANAYDITHENAPAPSKSLFVNQQKAASVPVAAGTLPQARVAVERKIIRTTSLSMIVLHPAEISQKISGLADALGGYLVSSESGGENSATLTIRVPASRFEEARAEIRKLGLRIEGEKVEAQDVTTQYVDQDANLRNLRAEEAGYLSILKQAHTVKDMLAVSEQLSNVRGQIEQQQAEFNSLSNQIDTVAISLSLRTETETQVFGLNWRPLYQLKIALRDGLDAVGNYATAMVSILFYLPSVILWLGTIFIAGLGSWRLVRWIGRRWFGWNAVPANVQG